MGRVVLKYLNNYYHEKVKTGDIVALENVVTGETLIVSREVYFSEEFRAVLVEVSIKEISLVGELME